MAAFVKYPLHKKLFDRKMQLYYMIESVRSDDVFEKQIVLIMEHTCNV